MKQETWIVCGGGVRAIFAAFLLLKKGKKVIIFNKTPFLGGVLHSSTYENYLLDKGCHMFANTSIEVTDLFMELIGRENYHLVDLKIGGILNDKVTDEIALPNLISLGETTCKTVLYELLHNLVKDSSKIPISLFDELTTRFGNTAAKLLSEYFQKAYQLKASQATNNSIYDLTLSLNRLKLVPDDLGNKLKELEVLDHLLAVASQRNPLRFVDQATREKYNFLSFYPSKRGLLDFCTLAKQKLIELGAEFVTGEKVQSIDYSSSKIKLIGNKNTVLEGDKLFWAGNIEEVGNVFTDDLDTKQFMHRVPMVIAYFFTNKKEISDYTYLHNFDEKDKYFRVSIPPNYGRELAPKGKSYLCCEMPTNIGSPVWNQPKSYMEDVWQSFLHHKIVTAKQPDSFYIMKTPVSYKVPKVGWEDAIKTLKEKIPTNRIFGIATNNYSKNSIVTSILQEFKNL